MDGIRTKLIDKFSNHPLFRVIYYKKETSINYRGSKSITTLQNFITKNVIVKEQRVYGSWQGLNPSLRCTLMDNVSCYQISSFFNQFYSHRFYTTVVQLSEKQIRFNDWFLTGFVDGEGCFSIDIAKSKVYKTGWQIKLRFSIGLHKKDQAILEYIQIYLGVGHIYKQGLNSVRFVIQSIEDLTKITEHLDLFPLFTEKRRDYELFKIALSIMQKNEHLTVDGLKKIVALKLSINWGKISPHLEDAFPNITPINKPSPSLKALPDVKNQQILNPFWLAGFTSAEGCFMVKIEKSRTYSTGFKVRLVFQITQHMRDEQLIKSFIEFFDCGAVYKRGDSCDFKVVKLDDICQTYRSSPFFKNTKLLV